MSEPITHVGIDAHKAELQLQPKQDPPKPWDEAGRQPGGIIALMQRPQPLVPDPHRRL